jgi:hypothetical protein
VFTFSLKLLSETFLILRIIQQDIIINVQRYSGKLTIINNYNETSILSIFKKSSNIVFHDNPHSGSQDRHDMTKLTVSLAIFRTHLKTTNQDQTFTYILLLCKDRFIMPLSVNCHTNLHTAGEIYHSLDKNNPCCMTFHWTALV